MSKLLYPEEHQGCFRYEGGKCPSIEAVDYQNEYKWESTLYEGEIIIVRKGSLILSYDHFLNHRVVQNKILLLPPGCHMKAVAEAGSSLLIFRLKEVIRLCESFTIDHIKKLSDNVIQSNQLYTLDVNIPIAAFINALTIYLSGGLKCSVFLKQKIDELMLLLRAYYPKGDLASFFMPVISNTSDFTNFVLSNYRKVKTVKELANMYSCSLSCFDKKFRRAFGKAPYRWMQEKKLKLIYHEIRVTNKPIKQIAEEQMFTSLPQFNDYCKKHFGHPPGKMRKIAVHELILNG